MRVNPPAFPQYEAWSQSQAGVYTPTSKIWGPTTNVPTANATRAGRFVLPKPRRITAIGIIVSNAATNDDSCDVAILDGSLNRLVSSGSTAGKLNSTGSKSISLTSAISLEANTVYYSCFSYSTIGGTAATIAAQTCSQNLYAQAFGSSAPQVEVGTQTVHPIPTSLTNPPTATSVAILLVLLD